MFGRQSQGEFFSSELYRINFVCFLAPSSPEILIHTVLQDVAIHLDCRCSFFVIMMVMSVCKQCHSFSQQPHRNPHSHPETTNTSKNSLTQMWGQIQRAAGHFPYIQHFLSTFSTCFLFICTMPPILCCFVPISLFLIWFAAGLKLYFSVNEPVVSESLSLNIDIQFLFIE